MSKGLGGSKILVTGGAGFIGSHLAGRLYKEGNFVRIVDIKEPEFIKSRYYNEFLKLDLRQYDNCLKVTENIDRVFNFAANMGGIGFITEVGADVMRDNVLINTNMLEASRINTFLVPQHAFTLSSNKLFLMFQDSKKATLILLIQTNFTGGKNFSAKKCARLTEEITI
jgi:nucleoside-diphosphate-sugar epimerase